MHRFLEGDLRPSGKNVMVEYEIVPHHDEDFHACVRETLKALRIGIHHGHGHRLGPEIFDYNQKEHRVTASFAPELFEPGNLPQHLSIIAGTIFDQSLALRIRILDIHWSDGLQANFPGPAHGLTKIREQTGIRDRPLSSVLLLPKSGISIKECIERSYQVWMGGCDIVEDSEMLASTAANDFSERVDYLSKEMLNAGKRTKQQKIYIPNITSGNLLEMERRAKQAKDAGLQFVVVNSPQIGFIALDSLRQTCLELGLFLVANNNGQRLLNAPKNSGFSRPVIAQIYRHLGVDLLHIASEPNDETKHEVSSLNDPFHDHHLHQSTVMPICSAIRHTGQVEKIVKTLGYDLVLQAEEAVYEHPDGLKAGAEAFHEAILAAAQGINKERAAENNEALKKALDTSLSGQRP